MPLIWRRLPAWVSLMGELEFFLKVALTCAIFQEIFSFVFAGRQFDFWSQVLIYWGVGSISYYLLGFLIERGIKRHSALKDRLCIRATPVRPQAFPAFTLKGILLGEIRGFLAALVIIGITRPVEREPDFLANVAWFFASIVLADFLFYVQHRMLHRKKFFKIHRRHHEFRDTSSFVAGHKSFTEYCLTSVTDLALFLILGRDLAQLCAWTLVGNAYNLEGHSSLSLFYVGTDFHDRHHTHFNRNFGIQGFWDKIFGTHECASMNQGALFLANRFTRWVNTRIAPRATP